MIKRIAVLITITVMISGFAACSGQSAVPVTETIATPTASQAPLRTPKPTETATPAPTAAPAPTATPAPTKNKTVIIAGYDGEIRGGHSKGKWLSQSEAAKLCKGKMTFNRYNFDEFMGTVETSGVTHEEEDEYASETYPDASGCFYLNIPEDVNADDYYPSYMYSGGKLPDIEIIPDTEDISSSAVQNLLDEKMGKGAAEADIWDASIADIDGDGEKETVVQAGDERADTTYYGLLCVIESDGTAKEIYLVNDEQAFESFYLQCIIDIDGDGISELVIDETWGSDSGTKVFKYDGKKVKKVMDYYMMDVCP